MNSIKTTKTISKKFSFKINSLEPFVEKIGRFFEIKYYHSSFRIEFFAGLTTFMTMSYILLVNPQVLSGAGMDITAVFIATTLCCFIGCLLMGLLSNYPVTVAPSMGLNTYFTYTIVQHCGYSWQTALGATFLSGLLFIFLSISRIRKAIIHAIPHTLSIGISVGIGLFLIIISLSNAHFIIRQSNGFHIGSLYSLSNLLFIYGLVLIFALDLLRIREAIIISIICTTVLSILLGINTYQGMIALPHGLSHTLLALDFQPLFTVKGLMIIFSILLVTLFDSTGTLVGILQRTHLQHDPLSANRLSRALLADSITTVVASCLGSSSTTPYIESASGVRAGGRTGLTALTVSFLFLLAIFFSPLIKTVPSYAVAPALFYVGCLMIKHISDLKRVDLPEWIPCLCATIAIPLTFSIADGIGAGFISYVGLKILQGKLRSLNILLIIFSILFILYFIYQ